MNWGNLQADAQASGASPPQAAASGSAYDAYLKAYDAAPDNATKVALGNQYAASINSVQPAAASPAPSSSPASAGMNWGTLQSDAASLPSPKVQSQPSPLSFGQQVEQQGGNAAAGLVRGAGSIGATLLSPFDAAARSVNGGQPINVGGYDVLGQDRRSEMDSALGAMGADTNSLAFKSGKLGSEIAGTAGMGGVLANALRALPAVAFAAPGAQALANALGSGGFSLGDAATGSTLANVGIRAAGGALTGGASAGLVDPSSAGTGASIGAALPMVGSAIAPTFKAVGGVAASIPAHLLGTTTGAGSDAISTAFQAGKTGSSAFLDNLRGNVPMADVVDQARQGIASLRATRGVAYRAGMGNVAADKTVLNFQPITDAVDSVNSTGLYKGQRINGSAADTLGAITDKVNQWQALDPKEFHTPEGFDALKQSIGDIRDSTPFATPARRAADTAYNAVKGQIVAQAPDYAKTMQGYANASDQINEITKALSLGEKTSADTSLRKLQSLMRNNAQTNYGNRLSLAQALQEQGNTDLMPSLAGQALSSWTPRGMVGALEKGGGVLGALAHPAAIPGILGGAPFMSPRLMGEAAYGAGRISAKADPRALGRALMQGVGVSPQSISSASQKSLPLAKALIRQGVVLSPSVSQ